MRILATYANSATQTVQYLSDHNAGLFTANSASSQQLTLYPGSTAAGNLGYINIVFRNCNIQQCNNYWNAGSFVVGVAYVIVSLGNTNWAAIGANNASVGAIFTRLELVQVLVQHLFLVQFVRCNDS